MRPSEVIKLGPVLLDRFLYFQLDTNCWRESSTTESVTKSIHTYQSNRPDLNPKRGCGDQVLALTIHIEAGFEDRRKTALVLVDLSSAFDTVWKKNALLKLAKTIQCKKTIDLMASMMSNRMLQVVIGGKKSSMRRMNNGLPQGAVLSSLQFILYTSDMPATISRKFLLADNLALATQYLYNELSERFTVAILNRDLLKLEEYYASERLLPNPEKTDVSTVHLSTVAARRTIEVQFCGSTVKYNPTPKYLGIPIDRSLTTTSMRRNFVPKLGRDVTSSKNSPAHPGVQQQKR